MKKHKKHKKCCIDNDIRGEGTSLLTRVLPILNPAYSPIDHYNTQDILVFAKHYADLVRYYDLDDSIDWVDFENKVETRPCNEAEIPQPHKTDQSVQQYKKPSSDKNQITTWKEFFYQDIAVVVASISRWQKKLDNIKKEYNRNREETEANPTRENFRELFITIINHLKRIDRWYHRSVYNHPLKAELEIQIKSFLVPALKQLISYDKGMILNVADDLDLVTRYETFKGGIWDVSFDAIAPEDSVYVGNNVKQKIIYALMFVDDVFNTMYKTYEGITKRSDYYWQQAIEKFPTHQPHMALFIAFVELFSYARNGLNDLTRKHMEFFYRDILHLNEKPARPDSVYLIYELAKGFDKYDLKEGRELTAGKDALGKQLIYKTDKELVINKAKVKQLKTLFLDKGSPIENIYAAPVANSADGKGEKFKDPETAWSTFGYFEPREEGDELTGEYAKSGLAIASPQFLLSGGERTIVIRIKLQGNDKRIDEELKDALEKNKKLQELVIKSVGDTNLIEDFRKIIQDDAKSKKLLAELDTDSAETFTKLQKKVRAELSMFRIPNESIKLYFSGKEEWIQPANQNETILEEEAKVVGPAYFSEQETILEFINQEKSQKDIILENLAKNGRNTIRPFDDYTSDIPKKITDPAQKFGTLSLLFDKIGADNLSDLLYTFSDQYIGWNRARNELYLKASIHTKEKAIVAYNNEKLLENYPTTYPVCKIEFAGDSGLYEMFKDAVIESTEIFVRVKDLTDVIIETDDGPTDASKPIYLLTARPQINSSFSIGSPEFIDKTINRLRVRGEWIGKMDFADRYKLYSDGKTDPAKYVCAEAIFYDNEWHPQNVEPIPLFTPVTKDSNLYYLSIDIKEKAFEKDSIPSLKRPIEKGISSAEATENNNAQLVRFTLVGQDFGHDEFADVTATQLANRLNIKGENVDLPATTDKKIYVPKAPFSPQVKSVTVDYISSQWLHNPNAQVFHIYPFGFTEIYPYPLIREGVNADSLINILLAEPLSSGIADPVKEEMSLIQPFKQKRRPPLLLPAFDKLLKKENETDQLIIPSFFLLPQFKFGSDQTLIDNLEFRNDLVALTHDEFKKKKYFHINQYESLIIQQGHLYIGIENLVPPQNLSLLFKFADGTAYDNDSTPPKINWSYLVNNEWFHLPVDHVITDATYDFQTTGIILFDFPQDATNNNTILPAGLYWLCASIDSDAKMVPKLIDVVAQANQATFFDQQNDPAHYNGPLPAKKISKPLVKIPEVKSIIQPFESFDGKPVEDSQQFYQRVSERLRHKGRAVTPSDYEHLILEEFPSVYKVKVLSHTDPLCLCRPADNETPHKEYCCCPQLAPGHVLVVAISNLRNKNAVDPLKPRTGRRTLLKIEEFLKKKVSPFVHIHAKNPKFEEVKVAFNVKFYTGIDKGFYLKQLNDDIMKYLTPWAYDSNVEIAFGNKIYASNIIDFIEGLKYVDYITCFRMIQIAEGCCKSLPDMDCSDMHADLTKGSEAKRINLKARFINEVSARSSQAILVSAKQHCIELIEDEPLGNECNCGGKNKTKYDENISNNR